VLRGAAEYSVCAGVYLSHNFGQYAIISKKVANFEPLEFLQTH
jgi:hypothetical protein